MLAELGRGALGVVYRAVHDASNRECAVKVVVPEKAGTETSLAMFVREINVLSQLRHPRIVAFHEMGLHEGRLFLSMTASRSAATRFAATHTTRADDFL